LSRKFFNAQIGDELAGQPFPTPFRFRDKESAYGQEHPGGQTGGQLEEELLLFPGVIMEILPKT